MLVANGQAVRQLQNWEEIVNINDVRSIQRVFLENLMKSSVSFLCFLSLLSSFLSQFLFFHILFFFFLLVEY